MFIRSWENHYVSRSGVFIFSQETSALAGNNYFEKKVWVLRNYALLWRLLDSLFTAQKERGNLHSVVEIAKVAFVMRLRDPAGSFMSLCIALSLAHDCTPMASTACKTHGSSSLARLFWTGCPVQFFGHIFTIQFQVFNALQCLLFMRKQILSSWYAICRHYPVVIVAQGLKRVWLSFKHGSQ